MSDTLRNATGGELDMPEPHHLQIALDRMQAEAWESALWSLNEQLRRQPQDAVALLLRAKVRLQLQDKNAAAADVAAAIETALDSQRFERLSPWIDNVVRNDPTMWALTLQRMDVPWQLYALLTRQLADKPEALQRLRDNLHGDFEWRVSLIEQFPSTSEPLRDRRARAGYLCAQFRDWSQAAQHLLAALKMEDATSGFTPDLPASAAMLLLKTGAQEQGIQTCRNAFDRLLDTLPEDVDQLDVATIDGEDVYFVAMCSLVRPEILDGAQTEEVLRVIESLVSDELVAEKSPYLRNALALARYRDGDFQAAIEAASKQVDDEGHQVNRDLIRAMALNQLGRSDEAQALLESVRKELAQYGPDSETGTMPGKWLTPGTWFVWLHTELLLSELEGERE